MDDIIFSDDVLNFIDLDEIMWITEEEVGGATLPLKNVFGRPFSGVFR